MRNEILAFFLIGMLMLGCAAPAKAAQNPEAAKQVEPEKTAAGNQSLNAPIPVQTGGVNAAKNTANASSVAEQPKAAEENKTMPEMKRGRADPSLEVPIYDPEKAYFGTTLLPDNHDLGNPRIIEVNMLGEVLWEYSLPADMKQYTNPGFDAEMLQNGNILFTLPRKGVYEVNRDKEIVWSYADPKVSHDADRLPNGNTLIAFGAYDGKSDAQAKEVNPAGKVVWSYYAKNHFGNIAEYKDLNEEGWTHTNAVMRLADGNTVVSHRNFNLLAVVDAQGNVVGTVESGEFVAQHDPVYLPNGNLLFATHTTPQMAVELDANNTVAWSFAVRERTAWPLRDVDRLPNGNTLVTGADRILEITPEGEIAWELKMNGVAFASQMDYAAKGFYKSQRLAS
jgi:hypothetical protein